MTDDEMAVLGEQDTCKEMALGACGSLGDRGK